MLKELLDLKEHVKVGEQSQEIKEFKKDLESVQQSMTAYENTQQDMHLAINELNEHVNDHVSQFDEHSILMMQQEME